jgi:HD superfamily phosphohydrolase
MMINNDNIAHVIKDPVHGTMQFTAAENSWIKPFIDSPNFQRLRHIKQLGMGDLIFPGAVHTRFNHSLGCSYIASQISHKIGLSDEERQLVIIACLLHDTGHGPFSHAFEDVFHNKTIRHEDWTPFFLADYRNKTFFEEYNRANPRHNLTHDKFKLIEDMIMHKSQGKRVLSDIVSSQLDADRLDYLLRDSHFCGVSYGEFDFRWMLNCMTIVNSGGEESLGITHKGIGVVEHYLVARRLMTRNIYHYQKKLAIELYLIQLLRSLAEDLNDYKPYAAIKATRLGEFLLKVNVFNQTIKSATDINKCKQDFLEKNHSHYKELCDYDIFMIIRLLSDMSDDHPATHIAKRIQHRLMPKIVRLDRTSLQAVEPMIVEFKQAHKNDFQDWQIAFLKTPHQSYKIEADPILVVNERGIIKPINEISLMINAISDKYEHTAFLCIDKEIFNDERINHLIEKLNNKIMEINYEQSDQSTSL